MGCSSSSQVAPTMLQKPNKKDNSAAAKAMVALVNTSIIPSEQRQRINAITDYWFRVGWDRQSYPGADSVTKKWFSFSLEVDRDVREKFLADYESYMKEEFEEWLNDRDGKLASIILLD